MLDYIPAGFLQQHYNPGYTRSKPSGGYPPGAEINWFLDILLPEKIPQNYTLPYVPTNKDFMDIFLSIGLVELRGSIAATVTPLGWRFVEDMAAIHVI